MAFEPEFIVTVRLLRTVESIAALRERIAAATVQVAWMGCVVGRLSGSVASRPQVSIYWPPCPCRAEARRRCAWNVESRVVAAAVITNFPTDGHHAYKVRFDDGTEAMLRRTEFSILKEFKPDEAVGRDSAPSGSDFEFWKPVIIYQTSKRLRDEPVQEVGSGPPAPCGEGELSVRLDSYRAALLASKRGEQPWPEVNAWRLRLHKEFDEAFASTRLPERPDYVWANDLFLKASRVMTRSTEPG